MLLGPRSLPTSPPPAVHTTQREADWGTLLVSWWATGFAITIIVVRLCGRKIRSNVLFREDWIMVWALIPLAARMAVIHLVLIYGTNNIQTEGVSYTDVQLHRMSLGSRLVLPARILYAMFIWMSKWCVSEFLKRITVSIWRPSYEFVLHCIRVFLVATFIAVIIATLTECQPFDDYWQVIPDPGPQCRQGFAQLITMGTADMITDILLVAFPVPIVLRSGQTWKRKMQLAALFSTSIALIVITGLRIPNVISHRGKQQYRTVWASCEILASAFVSNFVMIGSFIRDKGTKRNRYKTNSVTDSIDRVSSRRPTMAALPSAGSDEDLFRALGCRLPEHLRHKEEPVARPAPVALPMMSSPFANTGRMFEEVEGAYGRPIPATRDSDISPHDTPLEGLPLPSPATSSITKKNVSFFDVGGLLEDGDSISHSPGSQPRSTTIISSGNSHTLAQDFATPSTPTSRRGSHAFLSDIGGLMGPANGRGETPYANAIPRRGSLPGYGTGTRNRNAPTGVLGPMLERQETLQSLQDAGGLLAERSENEMQELGRPSPSRGPPSGVSTPRIQQHYSQNTLQDVGGLLQQREQDREVGVAALEYAARSHRPSDTQLGAFSPAIAQRVQGPDDITLHDPGGLLGR